MYGHPSNYRAARNPRRQTFQSRRPQNEITRPLLRQFVRTRRSDPEYHAYVMEVKEGPAVNGNTNAAASKSIPQPWVTVRDHKQTVQSVGLPVSICNDLIKHLLLCAVEEEVDDSGEVGTSCVSPDSYEQAAHASGDGKSTAGEVDAGKSPSQKVVTSTQTRPFQLSKLTPLKLVCEATGCTLQVTNRDPLAKRPPANSDEPEQSVPVDPTRRWLLSIPSKPVADQNGDGNANSGRRKQPWEACGVVELHEGLLPQLLIFLEDVSTRYRAFEDVPQVRSLYSVSGGRRFFFDLRDTRWGKRLHISQVTDLHRNVIGVPLEVLVGFRARLDEIIHSLRLDQQLYVRSERRKSNQRSETASTDRNVVDSADNFGQKEDAAAGNKNERQRGRRRSRYSGTKQQQQPQQQQQQQKPQHQHQQVNEKTVFVPDYSNTKNGRPKARNKGGREFANEVATPVKIVPTSTQGTQMARAGNA